MGHVVVTGAAGFIGSSVVRQMREQGRRVIAVLEPGGDAANLAGVDVERETADICDYAAMRKILDGAEALHHLAAVYKVWLPDPSIIYRVNLEGTTSTLLAARDAKVPRVVYTASIAAVGRREDGQPADETNVFDEYAIANEYILTKYLSERIAFRFAESGDPIVIVNPAFPFGARDRGPTPTGQILLTIARGEAPALPSGGFNCVDVDVVAEGHLLAEEKGRVGERYILGDHDVSYREFAATIGHVLGREVRAPSLPTPAAVAAAWGYEQVARYVTHRPPPVTVRTARYAQLTHYYDVSKARRELGLGTVPLETSIKRALDWYAANGFL